MGHLKTVVVSVIVGLMVFAAYWYFTGSTNATEDFEDNTNEDYTAYATFKVSINIISARTSGLLLNPFTGNITQLTWDVSEYVSMSQGRVFESGTLGIRVGDPIGEYVVKILVMGPGSYQSSWESSTGYILPHDYTDPQESTIYTGRCFFEDPGRYSVTISLNSYDYTTGARLILDQIVKQAEVEV